LVKKGLTQQKMARDIDFRAPDGRESLWTTGEKTRFSRALTQPKAQGLSIFEVFDFDQL
jgi:hypothetical protein